MDLVAGAVGSIVPKLGALLQAEYKLQKGLPEQIESLKNELESAHTALLTVGETPPEQLNRQVRLWAGDVREASYDMEDILDTFLIEVVDAAAQPERKDGQLKRLKEKMAKLFKKSKARHNIAGAIEDMKKRLQEVSDRRDRYSVPVAVPAPATMVDPRLMHTHSEASQIIGIERTKAELIAMLQPSSDVSDSSSNKMVIVSVVGAGGLGKTTLAKVVYDELSPGAGYDCRAFVSVGRKPDLVQIFTSIFFHLDQTKYQAIRDVKDIQLLIGELRKFLENQRYFIVIDDVWDIKSWEAIGSALNQKNRASRVIKTTRNLVVACNDEVYQLGALTHENSKKLFYMRLFGGEDKCPPNHPEEASEKILQKCGGVPLAIITMASLLVGKSIQHWFELCSSPGFYRGRDNKQLVDDTDWILSLSYYDLPSHLKTCLLYLSVYPEDYEIDKISLIWKWVAEGFIENIAGRSMFQLGEEYFHQLINRSMIQGLDSEKEGIIGSCRVHDMVLDLIRDLSCEENFITFATDEGGISSHQKVRRLAHQKRILLDQFDADGHMEMTQVRSFVAHMCDINGRVLHPSFKLLRVLALENCIYDVCYDRIWREGQDPMVFDSRKPEDVGCSRVARAPVVMPNLQELWFNVPVSAFYKEGHATCDTLGMDLECLPSLRYVRVCVDCQGAFVDDVNKTEAELRRRVELHPNGSALEVYKYRANILDMVERPIHKDDEEPRNEEDEEETEEEMEDEEETEDEEEIQEEWRTTKRPGRS